MRTVYIDLSVDSTETSEKIYAGYTGEHNATELVAEIPQAMARESEYLVAVFLTGDKIIRSRKITAERDYGAPYLDGNEVHIYLSQKLTGNTTLGIQIEGYAKDENGISTLVGKSAYLSNLTFRLSPSGKSDNDLMPDYDEISALIKKASENSGKGIERYETYDSLPTDAEDGDIAYVLHDSGELLTGDFEFEKQYARFVPKRSIETESLKDLPALDIDEDDGISLRGAGIQFRSVSAEKDRICYCSFLYTESLGSVIAFADFASQNDLDKYGKNETLYICITKEGDFAPLIESDTPVLLSPGWYKMSERRTNYHIDNGYLDYDYTFDFEPVGYEDITAFESLRNCTAWAEFEGDDDADNLSAAAGTVKICLDVYPEPLERSGLYLFKNGKWEYLPQIKTITVPTRPDLPVSAEDGQTAVVECSTLMIENTRSYIYPGSQWKKVFINPEPQDWMWLTDCRIKANIGYYDTETWEFVTYSENTGFELFSDKEQGYALLRLCGNPWDQNGQYYVYARKKGKISLPSGTFGKDGITVITANKDWSKVYINDDGIVVDRIENYNNLPKVDLSNYSGTDYYFRITEYECEMHEQSFLGEYKFFESDNAKGLWYFSLGNWYKVGNENAET